MKALFRNTTLITMMLIGLMVGITNCATTPATSNSSSTSSNDDTTDTESETETEETDSNSTEPTTDANTGDTVQNLATTPCGTPYAQLALTDTTILIGCNEGNGFYISRDGGSTFNEIDMSAVLNGSANDFDVYDLVAISDTELFICGQDNGSPGVYLWSFDVSNNMVTKLYESSDTPGITFDHCESVAQDGTTLVLSELNGSDVVYSNDNGATWTVSAETSSVSRLISTGSDAIGIGGTLTNGQLFSFNNDQFREIDLNKPEARSIAMNSNNVFLIGGGGGASEAYITMTTNGQSFTEATLNNSVGLFRVEGIVCPSGNTCFAMAQSNSNKTFIYKSTDNGATWTELSTTSNGIPYDITASDGFVFIGTGNGDLIKITL